MKMRLIDADKLPYSNVKTNKYGYVEVTETVVLEEEIANAQTVKAIPLDKVKRAREEIDDLYRYYDESYVTGNNDPMFKCKEVFEILDKLIAESEG